MASVDLPLGELMTTVMCNRFCCPGLFRSRRNSTSITRPRPGQPSPNTRAEHDPAQLATFRDRRRRATPAEITAALTGHYRPELLFALQQTLAAITKSNYQIDHRVTAARSPDPSFLVRREKRICRDMFPDS